MFGRLVGRVGADVGGGIYDAEGEFALCIEERRTVLVSRGGFLPV